MNDELLLMEQELSTSEEAVDDHQMFSPTRWVSSSELAEYFSVTTKTIDRWRKRGVISDFAVKLPGRGKGYRYDIRKVEKSFLALR